MLLLEQKDVKENAKAFQKGVFSIQNITDIMLNGKVYEKENLKTKILSFIRTKKEVSISELIEEFDVEPSIIIEILNDLKKEKNIRKVE
jgi:DeoR/GlpR family transcriptional regulator of sugar metabolism